MLRLELLGTPNLTVSGRTVKLGVKHISMLAYLALEGRTSRRVLGNILWADAPNALNNISVARNLVVKALGKDSLEVDADSLALTPDFTCDVLEWRIGATQTNQAVWDLWRGGFLTGLRLTDWEMGLGAEFEDWLFATRESLIFERREFAARLGRTQLQLGNYETAVTYLEVTQTQGGDPLEDACRHLILACGASRKTDQAALAYNTLSKVLQDELGVQPSQRTKDALELVRSAQFEACRAALQFELGVKTTTPTERHLVPFVGRETELRTIVDFLRNERVVVIHGEPGAGKSRLALEVCHSLEQHSIIRLRCHQESLRYSLLESLVRQHFKQFPDAVQSLNVSEQAALANLVPDLIEVGLSATLESLVLFNAVKSLLPNASTVLVIDDTQWIDAASLEFLVFLLERTTDSALKLMLTKRNFQTSRSAVQTSLGSVRAKHLTLSALSETAIRTLALSLDAKQVDIPALLKRSGGNAFFVLELLQFAVSGETKAVEMVQLRLQSLSEPAQQVLEALCIRNLATFAHLRSISGRSLEELNLALEELGHAALVTSENNQITFVHDIVREVIESELSPSRRNLLHYRAAQIKDQHTARHYWEAKSVWDEKDEQHAHQVFLEFGRAQAGRGDLTEALKWLERSLNTAQNTDARAEVFLETANTLENFGRHQQALEELETAASISSSLEPVLKARLLNTRAWILQREYRDFDQSKIILENALEILKNQNSLGAQNTLSETHNLLGSLEYNTQNYPDALEHYKKASRIRRVTGNQIGLADSIGGMGLVYMALNDSKAESHLLDCLHIRETLGDVHGIARVLTNIGMYYGQQNQFEKALGFQKKTLELQQQLENPTSVAIALNNLGVTYFEMGHYQNALLQYQHAIETLEINDLPVRQDFHDNLEEVTAKLVLPR